MDFIKRRLPVIIVVVVGFGLIAQYYIPTEFSDKALTGVTSWISIIAAFTLVIGIASLLRNHYLKIRQQRQGWGYSIVLYISFFTMAILGLFFGIDAGSGFLWIFQNIQTPLASTTFSLTAFFICSAAYRSFRAKSFEASLMMVVAIIVMIGRIPFGEQLSKHFPSYIPGFSGTASWVFNFPGMAARRALSLGIGIGGIATSLRIILGIERTYQGKD